MRTMTLLILLAATAAVAQPLPPAVAERPPAREPELPASDLLVRYESPALRYRWSLAPEAALEPALVRLLRAEALAEREQARTKADAALASARAARLPERAQVWQVRWQKEAETDGLLAFSARDHEDSGGAHGNLAFRVLLWDRASERRLTAAELFTDPKAALAALTPAFCRALDAERTRRRQGQASASFSDCPALAGVPLVPVGDGAVTSVRLLLAPYEAGPWAEGAYEITLSTDPLLPFIAPRYAAAFAKR